MGTTDSTPLQMNLIERVNVGDIVTRSADVHPREVAVVDGGRRLTYAELDQQVTRLGHALLGLGLQPQDVVGVVSRNTIELVVAYFACARAGLVCAPANLGLRPAEMAWCLRDAKARVLILERALGPVAEAVVAEDLPDAQHRYWIDAGSDGGRADGLAALMAQGRDEPLEVLIPDRAAVQLLYTSGTTAQPKGVLTSHLAVTLAALSNAIGHQCTPGYAALVQLPLFHCAMLNSILMPLLATGGRVVLFPGFEAHAVARLLAEEDINLVVMLPMMYGQLLDDPALADRRYPAMKRAMYAMAALGKDRLEAIHAMFPNADVVLGSGQTEFTPATCMQRPEHQWSKSATWGTATAMTRVAIMDDQGRLLPRGETGEIVYRGPLGMTGYLNQPEATRASFRQGWFHSGDVAHIDEDGAIWFKDRTKDVIKTGGENVASLEVERCLLGHPAVAEVAVVGMPHPHWGEAVTAAVLPRPGMQATQADLIDWCRERLAGFKAPKAVVFVDQYPRTGTGKVQKHLLRAQLAARQHKHDESTPS